MSCFGGGGSFLNNFRCVLESSAEIARVCVCVCPPPFPGVSFFTLSHLGVDLNSFIWDPSFLARKNFSQTFAFLCIFVSPKYCFYLCHVCCMMDIKFVHVNGFFSTGKYAKNFTVCQHVSSI